jgi:menaquinol-cytochrome c reductase iron-sulfur subunit
VAEGLERPGEGPGQHESGPHLPSPTIWPAGFAAGIALVLVGLIVNWLIVAVGAVLAIVFGYLWVRDVTKEVRAPAVEEIPPAAVAVHEDTLVDEEEAAPEEEQYTRSTFLAGSTLGLGALIGGIVTVPVLGFAVAPAFVDQGYRDVDLGPLSNFPEGEWRVATFFTAREAASVGLRTAFIRNNGLANGVPSMTIISSRCAHVGCPVQPSGPRGEPDAIETDSGRVTLISTQPSGFVCPCHGGAYDLEGNRTAGPPVRALDRYRYSIVEGNLVLNTPYSVGHVEDSGKDARIHAYRLVDPGQHVDGPEQIFYPYVP